MPCDLQDPKISKNTEIVLRKRYLRKNIAGDVVETPKQFFWRVASTIVEVERGSSQEKEEIARTFYNMMVNRDFLPNSPTLMNAGTELGQLSACFVLPVEDSIEGIFDAVKYAAMIHKSGGGTGFSFSRLRPKDSKVGSTGGVASGPLSFMKVFDVATEQIKQGGKRRGANMGILRVDHPDIKDFIHAKEEEGQLSNFNLSVGLTESFMVAVENNADYDLVDPTTQESAGKLNAKSIFDLLVKKAWESGDPGIVFLDRINSFNPTPEQGEIEATNPCGEQPLLPFEACNLGSINLAKFYNHNTNDIDFSRLRATVHNAVRFLDNVIDVSRFPIEQIANNVKKNRKIGLGIMGFADLLFQMGIPYDSEEGIRKAEEVMSFIQAEGYNASRLLASERGAFPSFDTSIFADLTPIRNATVTTIAPTGTLSIIGECSSGIEPIFALSFTRNIMDGQKLTEVSPYLEKALKDAGLHTPEILAEVAAKGSIQHIEAIPERIRRVFVTALDIAPEWHLRMQAAFQKYTDNAVSKTVNLPNSATEKDIHDIYVMAYKLNCKGVTVYRDGCKSVQVLTTGEGQKRQEGSTPQEPAPESTIRKVRPDIVQGFTQKVQTGLGTMYLTVNEVDGKPFEVFATIGKSGRSTTAKAEAIGRLVSLALRSGVGVREVVEQIKGIGGEHPIFRSKGLTLSIPDAIAWVLEKRYLRDNRVAGELALGEKPCCPECGEPLKFQEGCLSCTSCAYSRCG
ncbi:MAG: vitamin B12-dependent ribonucleotide reductase [Desulfovibrio sp.]|nr:vitamin B12-dependent ribonucleotide reductase [Desulfovibrio sp.]